MLNYIHFSTEKIQVQHPFKKETHMSSTAFFEDDLLTLREVLAYLRIGKTTFHEGIKKSHYPKPLKVSSHRSLWRKSEILESIKRMNPNSAL